MKKNLFVIAVLSAVVCLGALVGCSSGDSSSSNSAQQAGPKYTASVVEMTEGTINGQYGEATSSCALTGAEIYEQDGTDYLKVTLTVKAISTPKFAANITSYLPKAYQNKVEVRWDSKLCNDMPDSAPSWGKDIKEGGENSGTFYYPLGDLSDFEFEYGSDFPNLGKVPGHAVVRIEK